MSSKSWLNAIWHILTSWQNKRVAGNRWVCKLKEVFYTKAIAK